MIKRLKPARKDFWKDNVGATAIELALIALLIAVAAGLAMRALGLNLACVYDSVASYVSGGGGHACT